MKQICKAAALAACVLWGPAALAADGKADRPDRVCRLEPVVGSHLPKKVCTTAAEREALRKQAQNAVGGLKTQSSASAVRAGVN